MPDGWTLVESAPQAAAPKADGWTLVEPAEAPPDFKASSIPAYQTFGEPAAADGPIDLAKHWFDQVNPLPLTQLIPIPRMLGGGGVPLPKAIGGSGVDAGLPQAAANLLKAHGETFERARKAYDAGDHVSAAIHTMYWLLPVIGPALDKAGIEMKEGRWWSGLGDTLGLATALFGPEAVAGARTAPGVGRGSTAATRPPTPRLTPADVASNALARTEGIPIDAALATGSRFVRGVQKVAGESLLGSGPAERVVRQQTEGLERVGTKLADQVKPGAVSVEEGGGGVRQSITETIESLKGSADLQYGKVREIEARPEHEATIQTAATGSTGYRKILEKLSKGWRDDQGRQVTVRPTHPELYTMRQIAEELDAQPYQRGRLVVDDLETGANHYARGSRNADVYHEIQQAAGTDAMTGTEMKAGIAQTLETGDWNAASQAAYRVAQKRVQDAGGNVGGGPRLPDDAAILGRAERIQLPVDIRPAKQALEPLYARLQRENTIAPFDGPMKEAYGAIARLMEGPDHAALTEADAAAGRLKRLAATDDPLFRSQGQGAALKAARALEEAVQTKAGTVPELQQALEAGRAATKGKYQVGEIRDLLPEEPVQAFDKLTAPRDRNIETLRKVQEVAPEKMADLGRAKLQQWLDLASERGRFDHADRLYAEWNKLGPQTKRILFGEDPKLVEALDSFFLLAKRLHENPNPSGTATTSVKVGEVIGLVTHPLATLPATLTLGALSKLLYSPAGVRALSDLMKASASAPAAAAGRAAGSGSAAGRTAATAAALDRLAIVAKAQGVDLGLAADQGDPGR